MMVYMILDVSVVVGVCLIFDCCTVVPLFCIYIHSIHTLHVIDMQLWIYKLP